MMRCGSRSERILSSLANPADGGGMVFDGTDYRVAVWRVKRVTFSTCGGESKRQRVVVVRSAVALSVLIAGQR